MPRCGLEGFAAVAIDRPGCLAVSDAARARRIPESNMLCRRDEARTHMTQPMMYAYRLRELHEKDLSTTGGAMASSPAERPWLSRMRR
jgi:hypothetical protein